MIISPVIGSIAPIRPSSYASRPPPTLATAPSVAAGMPRMSAGSRRRILLSFVVMPSSLDDAKDLISALPEVTEGTRYGRPTWFVHGKGFAWERPLTKADIKRLGDEPVPGGPILALAVEDLADKAAVLEAGHDGIFTIAHFDGYPAVLIQLDEVDPDVLGEAILDAWLACAPEPLARSYLSERRSN